MEVSGNSKSIGGVVGVLRPVSGARRVSEELRRRRNGGGASSKTIMLQIYIPKAIEQSCWMCTLGRTGWSTARFRRAIPTVAREPLPSGLSLSLWSVLLLSRLSYPFVNVTQLDGTQASSVNHRLTINFSYHSVLLLLRRPSLALRWFFIIVVVVVVFLVLSLLPLSSPLSSSDDERNESAITETTSFLRANWICNADVSLLPLALLIVRLATFNAALFRALLRSFCQLHVSCGFSTSSQARDRGKLLCSWWLVFGCYAKLGRKIIASKLETLSDISYNKEFLQC